MEPALKAGLQIKELTPAAGHERLVHGYDEATGLNALISIHSTVRGPAAGGCRMFDYATFEDAVHDVERLSRGMTYKNAGADLPLGGGKSVIIGAPDKVKSPELMRAFGAFVDTIAGDYFTAEDVGISPQDLSYAAETSDFVVGLDGGPFASGDPSPHTAKGVFLSTKVAWQHLTGTDDLTGVRVAIQGLGHVGMSLAEQLYVAGAKLIVSDLRTDALEVARSRLGATVVDPSDIASQTADIFAPCAMGGALNDLTVPQLKVRAVVGAANNQLAGDHIGQALQDRGILYAPDYIVNGGGIINVAMEILKLRDPSFRQDRLAGVATTLRSIFAEAELTGELPHRIADTLIEQRLSS